MIDGVNWKLFLLIVNHSPDKYLVILVKNKRIIYNVSFRSKWLNQEE